MKKLKGRKLLRPSVGTSLHCANGETLNLRGILDLDFHLGSEKFTHPFYVISGLNRHCLLGNDFLEKHGAVINLQIRKLKVRNSYITMEDDIHIAAVVRSSRTVVMKPHTTVILEVRAKHSPYFQSNQEFEIVPPTKGFIAEEPAIQIEPVFIRFNAGKFPLLISNKSGKTIRIKRGCVVGLMDDQQKGINSTSCQSFSNPSKIDPIKIEEIVVSDKYRQQTIDLLSKNEDLNANSDLALEQTDTVKMTIDLKSEEPIKIRPYRTPLNKRRIIDQAIDDMLASKVIERSTSSFSFPIIIVDKKDGSSRFCVDFRKLNEVTKPIAYPLPLIDDILARLGNCQFFTSLDLRSGYWQVKMDEKDKEKTAFSCHRGLFQFLVMPFGLTNAPAVFMMLMQTVLQGLENFSLAYLDDILIFSKTAEEHQQHIQQVFDRLRAHKLKFKLKKCAFFQESTKYLGFNITKDGIQPDTEKVEAIKNMLPPSNVKEVRSFVGLCSYYRRFIPNFSQIAEPILDLTKKYARFIWTAECQKSFDYIKDSLSVVPLLMYPDTNKPYVLYTDASDTCIGACLSQLDESGEEKPIYFLSHRLSRTQTRWSTIEKEAFAIHYSLQKLHVYLHGAEFTIKTDHMPLKYLLESPMQNRKIQQWALTLSGYNCKVEYIKGQNNVLADMLSRLPARDGEVEEETQIDLNDNMYQVNAIDSNQIDPKRLATCKPDFGGMELPNLKDFDIVEEQSKDQEIQKIIQKLKNDPNHSLSKRYMIIDQVLYFVSSPNDEPVLRMYIPSHLREIVLEQYHDANGHMGVDKTYLTMGRKYFWPKMFQEAFSYVSACIPCQERVLKAKKAPLQNPELPPYPFAKVCMDISGPYPRSLSGNRYIVSLVDIYSGYPEAWPLPDKCADSIAHILIEEFFPRHSCPLQIVTDNGSENENRIVRETLKALNIDHITTSFYHPEANAKVERFHRTLHDILAKKLDQDITTWDLHLNQTLAAVRFSVSEPTKHSPFFLVYNRDPVLPVDNILKPRRKYVGEEPHQIALENMHFSFLTIHKRLRKAQNKQKQYADRNRQDIILQVGDPVYLKNHQRNSKLEKKWRPYFRVVEKLSNLTYKIRNQLNGTVTTSHVQHLRRAPIEQWPIPEEAGNRRAANYVVNPPGESDSDTESDQMSDSSHQTNGKEADDRPKPIDKIVRLKRNERDHSSSEEDIPLMELKRRLRARKARLAREQVSNQLKTISKRFPEYETESGENTDAEIRPTAQAKKRKGSGISDTSTENSSGQPDEEDMEVSAVSRRNEKKDTQKSIGKLLNILSTLM